MTTVSAVRTVAERLDYLLLADEGAPARYAGDLRAGIVQLLSDLSAIEKFLIEADGSNNIIDGDFRKRVTRLAYEIEDAVESYARQEAAGKSSGGLIISSLLEYCFTGRSLHKDLYIFRNRIDQLKHFMDAVNPVARSAGTREISRSSNSDEQEQVIGANIDYWPPVRIGMEENKERLRSYLLGGGKPELSVIAIRGMGGIGKTTLAKLLYNDPLLVKHFDSRAWAAIGQDFQARDILETMLLSLASGLLSKNEIAEMETMELMEQLYQAQKGRRYLIVLDDLWSEEAWDNLRFAFPDDCNGSRILITTWSIRVTAIATDVVEVRPLGMAESWQLFEIKSGLDDPDIEYIAADKMEMIGKEIVGHCAGVPLAIAVIGGILRAKNLEYWNLILHKLQQDFQNLHEDFQRTVKSVLHTIILSYKELPYHLKPCFIYLGHFPPDQAISVEILYLLWMAEGLISARDATDKARIEVAEDYFNELVNRSLVIVEEQEQASSSRRFKSCQVHDLIRDLCEWKGTREEFFQVIDFGSGNKKSFPTHRVAIYLNKFEDGNDFSVNVPEAKHIRAILFFDTDKSLPRSTWPREFSDLKGFQWTRVLNFDGVDFRVRKLPRGIEKLVYLRYLSFRGCYLLEFPYALSNFPFLETLDLRVRVSCVMTIPNVLRKLSRLRHLYFPLAFQSDTKDKLKLDSLKKLEILENFNASICDADDLLHLENLQILTGIVDGHNVDLKNTISTLNRVKLLGRSSIVVKNFDSYSVERLSIVAALLECNALNALDIEGYIGELPLHREIGSNFTELVFNGSEFKQDPMPVLGKLPNLRSLVLCNDAFVGKKMVCRELHFPQLRRLKLVTLHLIEELEMQTGALARLTILTIEQCDRLETIPYTLLAGIPTLTTLMIGSMPEGFQNGVNKLIEEMRELANDELTVTFYDC
ncbi:UNVERIFIED_CONTAM: putative disease resistance protein [Sesamum calycinum]|uniref:Disease resistance protein n=1 Tax=Sesamum calycinum TaxID=2727403 RepID=A0AAW2QLL5_9LAMI